MVQLLYSALTILAWQGLRLVALFNPKIKLFVLGRQKTFQRLALGMPPNTKSIWMHAASLGEYEQGLPVLQKLRATHPHYRIVLTFFSPSGYEIKKHAVVADVVVYLPMDTPTKVRRFLNTIRPALALFVKYEVWPNYLFELQKRNIPTVLISALFLKKQVFFKPYGGFMRKSLRCFSHYFVQNAASKTLLASIGITRVTVSGDTRFDRVAEIVARDNTLPFIEVFKADTFCCVAGSTWPEDEKILVQYLNTATTPQKCVLVPHTIHPNHIAHLKQSLQKKTLCFSEREGKDLSTFEVLLIDTVGLLSKIYAYADLAYVGGGFTAGVHNTLEPAVYGIPVIIGPEYNRFKEVKDLVHKKGIHVIANLEELHNIMHRFLHEPEFTAKTAAINATYVKEHTGATEVILRHISPLLPV